MTIEEIRTKYLKEYGYSYFNKMAASSEYTRFLEKELQEMKMQFDSMKEDKDLWERRYNQLAEK